MRALVTGVLGQDGSYLADQLLADGHEVFGLVRRSNVHVHSPAQLLRGDLLDQDSIERALTIARPDVVFNLAAVTSPGGAWGTPQPPLLAEVTAVGVVKLCDAMLNCAPDAKLVHASSSAIYDPQRYGLYGIAKQFAHQAVHGYRQQLWCSNAVLFSHTSPRQDPRFLARRICTTIARGERMVLGDVDSRRDWGYASDYTQALAVIAGQDQPGNFVVATGVRRSVRELVETALRVAGLMWDDVIIIDPGLPRIPDELPATPTVPGWTPQTSFEQMIRLLTA